jgi:hypothetical protein
MDTRERKQRRQDTDRLRYNIYRTYIEPSHRDLVALLERLADEGVIH